MVFKAMALVVGAMVCGTVSADEKDAKSLNGTWQVVSQWTDGKEDVIAKDGGDTLVVLDGKYTIKQGDKEIGKGTFTLDPKKTPMTIDNAMADGESKGKTALGIYHVSGDEVKVSSAKPGDADRPAGFDARSYRVTTFKRVKQ